MAVCHYDVATQAVPSPLPQSPRLRITTLGGLAIERDGAPVPNWGRRKAEALLAYLACTGRSHLRAALADLLWDDLPPDRVRANFRTVLVSLREIAGSLLRIDRQSVALPPSAGIWIDAAELEGLLHPAAGHAAIGEPLSPKAVTDLMRGLSLYRGDFLQGFTLRDGRGFEDWALAEQERLRRLVGAAHRRLIAHFRQHGDFAAGIEQASRLVRLDPLHEESHRQLMWLLAADGQRRAALAQYDACRRLLADEIGVDPEGETVALHRRLLAGDLALPLAHAPTLVRRSDAWAPHAGPDLPLARVAPRRFRCASFAIRARARHARRGEAR
jgi:DNA-binding SARP family transcriptional activator